MASNRDYFEEEAYKQYFISHVNKDLSLQGGMVDKDELLARGPDGTYTRPEISAMWFGWLLREKLYREQSMAKQVQVKANG